MSFLKDFERKVEILIEKTFLGGVSFKIETSEIVKRIWFDMTLNKIEEGGKTYIPDFIEIRLFNEEYNKIEGIINSINKEVIDYIQNESEHKGFYLKRPIRISWNCNKKIDKGLFAVRSYFKKDILITLKVIKGYDRGKIFELKEGKYSIGRDLNCDIVIGDPMVSRKHAMISIKGDKYILEDIGSKTGIYVNNVKIEREFLSPEDIIEVGSSSIEFIKVC